MINDAVDAAYITSIITERGSAIWKIFRWLWMLTERRAVMMKFDGGWPLDIIP